MKSRLGSKSIALVLSAAGLLGSGAGSAQDADLSVRGRLQPGACELSLSQGGVADLGSIPGRELNPSRANEKELAIDVAIDCATPQRVALRAQDNRQDSVVGGLDPWHRSPNLFGLGISAGRRSGDFHMYFGGGNKAGAKPDPIGDGQPLSAIMKNGTAGSPGGWVYDSRGYPINASGANLHAFMDKGATPLPKAYRNITAELTLSIWLNKASELDLTRQTPIDGSATLELVYL